MGFPTVGSSGAAVEIPESAKNRFPWLFHDPFLLLLVLFDFS
jgi:hypothetical protein